MYTDSALQMTYVQMSTFKMIYAPTPMPHLYKYHNQLFPPEVCFTSLTRQYIRQVVLLPSLDSCHPKKDPYSTEKLVNQNSHLSLISIFIDNRLHQNNYAHFHQV